MNDPALPVYKLCFRLLVPYFNIRPHPLFETLYSNFNYTIEMESAEPKGKKQTNHSIPTWRYHAELRGKKSHPKRTDPHFLPTKSFPKSFHFVVLEKFRLKKL